MKKIMSVELLIIVIIVFKRYPSTFSNGQIGKIGKISPECFMLVSYFALLLLKITFICYTIPYLLQFEAIKGGIKRLSDIVRTIRHLL